MIKACLIILIILIILSIGNMLLLIKVINQLTNRKGKFKLIRNKRNDKKTDFYNILGENEE